MAGTSTALGTAATAADGLRNENSNSGNLIGFVYDHQPDGNLGAGDHYEVLFSPTGNVHLDKVIQGTRYRLFISRHNAPPDQWFTVAPASTPCQ